jgi:hypothetical protein
MIKKIISGGQTGADQGALDAAIKLDIPHGGWIPKGRMTENGPLPEKYQLKEMPTQGYPERTEQNVIDSDGTLIISRGELTGGSDYTREMAIKHGRPFLHLDLMKTAAFKAASVVNAWIVENDIKVLNVAGPRASKDPLIYNDVLKIIEGTYFLGFVKVNTVGAYVDQQAGSAEVIPNSVDEAVDLLIESLPLKDKTTIANLTEDELKDLRFTLGIYIINQFGLDSGNRLLLDSCRLISRDKYLHHSQAPQVIIKALWKRLRKTHVLRVVKK